MLTLSAPAKPEGPSPSMSPLGGVSRQSRGTFRLSPSGAQRRAGDSPPKDGGRRGSRSTFDADEVAGVRKLSQMAGGGGGGDARRASAGLRTAEEEAETLKRAKDAKDARRNTAMKVTTSTTTPSTTY